MDVILAEFMYLCETDGLHVFIRIPKNWYFKESDPHSMYSTLQSCTFLSCHGFCLLTYQVTDTGATICVAHEGHVVYFHWLYSI